MHCFHLSKHQTTLPRKQQYNKPVSISPALTTKNSALINPTQLFEIVYLSISGICVSTIVCAICATSVQGRVSEQTLRKSPALAPPINKHLSKIIVFTIRQHKIIRPQTTRINIICILHPFHVQNHNKRSYANS